MSTDWNPVTFFRPNVATPGRGEWVIVDPIAGERVAVTGDAALRLVAARREPSDDGVERAIAEGVAHWRHHNWERSLAWYLFTRRCAFADATPDYARIQEQLIRSYAEAGAGPADRFVGDAAAARVLPVPADLPRESVGHVLFRRASTREFANRTIEGPVFSGLLWHGLKVLRRYSNQRDQLHSRDDFRRFTSVFDTYAVTYDVDGVAPGVHLYDCHAHALTTVIGDDLRQIMQRLMVGQRCSLKASATFLLVAEFERYQWRYRHERALRKLYVNSARFMHHLLLTATAFGLRTHISPAVRDRETLKLLGRDPIASQVIYTLTVG